MTKFSKCLITKTECVPDDDDSEIEQIPRVSQIGAGMGDESVSDDLHDAFYSEDDEENVFYFLLQYITEGAGGWSV